MWKWMSMLVLLALAMLWFWPEHQPVPNAELAVAGDNQPLSEPAPFIATETVSATDAAVPAQSCPEPKQLAEQLATLRASRQHQSETLERLMQEAQLRPELQLQYLR